MECQETLVATRDEQDVPQRIRIPEDSGLKEKGTSEVNTVEITTAVSRAYNFTSSFPDSPEEGPNHRTTFRQRLLFDTWFRELLALCINICFLLAIGGVLKSYDQRASPEMKHGLTLNAINSILATASKSGLILAVASSISQLKWCWMQKRNRRLHDLQLYDYASRGPSGSIIMLCTRSGQSLASIGAIITILAVAFDPFVQQLLRYPIRQVPKDSPAAMTKLAFFFNPFDYSTDLKAAIDTAIWSKPNQFARDPTCPSGNCTWPPFRSVGWCSQCEDITSYASLSGCTYNIDSDLPSPSVSNESYYGSSFEIPCSLELRQGAPGNRPIQGFERFDPNNSRYDIRTYAPTEMVWLVNGTSGQSNVGYKTTRELMLDNRAYAGVKNPLMVFAFASLELADAKSPGKRLTVSHVDQCVLSLCQRTYNTSVSDGVASSAILSTNWGVFEVYDFRQNRTMYAWNGTFTNFHGHGLIWTPFPEQIGDIKFDGAIDAELSTFMIDPAWYETIVPRIVGNATTELWWHRGEWINTTWYPWYSFGTNYSSDTIAAIAQDGLDTVLGNVAAALTRLGLDKSDATLSGTVGVSEVYVNVRWEWFVLPCLLELAGIGFLAVTIIVSDYQRIPTWKSPIFALLYHGLERELLYERPIDDTVSGMRQTAQSTYVRLKRSKSCDRTALRSEIETEG